MHIYHATVVYRYITGCNINRSGEGPDPERDQREKVRMRIFVTIRR